MKKILILLFSALFVTLYAAQKVTIYTYHNHAPFIIGKYKGLTYDVVNLLNKEAKGAYAFELKVVPRARLNYMLKPWINHSCGKTKKCNPYFMVLWVNHKWGFGKDSLSNFAWVPLFEDSNAIISLKSKKVEYTKPEDLIGMRLAGISGHKYLGIDELVKEGKMTRINGNSEVDNLEVVLSSRADVTLLPHSAFRYYQKINDEYMELYAAKTPNQRYVRNIMTRPENRKLVEFLQSLNLQSRF